MLSQKQKELVKRMDDLQKQMNVLNRKFKTIQKEAKALIRKHTESSDAKKVAEITKRLASKK